MWNSHCGSATHTWPHFYQTRSVWSMDQGSNENHSPVNNFVATVTKFCVLWEGQALPQDTKFSNCRDKIVDSRAFISWSLIHGSSWSGLIKLGPGDCLNIKMPSYQYRDPQVKDSFATILSLTWESPYMEIRSLYWNRAHKFVASFFMQKWKWQTAKHNPMEKENCS